jgi:hypothetical protein
MQGTSTPERRTHAVDASTYLLGIKATTWDQDNGSPVFYKLNPDKLEAEVRLFCAQLRNVMSTLPEPPCRSALTKEELRPFWAAIWPVKRSYKFALRMIGVLAHITALTLRAPVRRTDLVRDILYGDDNAEARVAVRLFFRLDSFLYRRSAKGQQYARKYFARPEVKERRKTRESKPEFRARNAERMRVARLKAKEER